jgi:hypothetical protein
MPKIRLRVWGCLKHVPLVHSAVDLHHRIAISMPSKHQKYRQRYVHLLSIINSVLNIWPRHPEYRQREVARRKMFVTQSSNHTIHTKRLSQCKSQGACGKPVSLGLSRVSGIQWNVVGPSLGCCEVLVTQLPLLRQSQLAYNLSLPYLSHTTNASHPGGADTSRYEVSSSFIHLSLLIGG